MASADDDEVHCTQDDARFLRLCGDTVSRTSLRHPVGGDTLFRRPDRYL